MNPKLIFLLAASCLLAACAGVPQQQERGDGIHVGEASSLRSLVPAAELEKTSAEQYLQLKQEAAGQHALAPANHPQLIRLRQIAARILPGAPRFNPDASHWQWEVNLIGSKEINAFCMPGGKIVVYSGIIETLHLTDDEIAVVMGHEVAHALREHARERIAKSHLTKVTTGVLGLFVGGPVSSLLNEGGNLLTLKFSRSNESEADLIGLDLAARAGYDPRAGVSLWQKMADSSKGKEPLAWLSTHPAGQDRIAEIEQHLPDVMPLYEANRDKPHPAAPGIAPKPAPERARQ